MGADNQKKEENKGAKNILEWAVFAVSLLLVIGILGYLGYKSYTHKPSSPQIQVTFTPSPSESAPYRYYVEVNNIGGETAEQVSIELVLEKDKETMENAELQISFIPKKSKREGWLNFSENPQMADTIFARVISFKKP